MRTRRRQPTLHCRKLAPPLLDADLNLRGLTGFRCSSARIVAVRPLLRQAPDRLHARSWRDQ